MTADDARDDEPKRRLEMTVAAIRARHGQLALRHLRPQYQEIPHVPTGFSTLDAALGIGGLPRGSLTELVSVPSAGTTTLALKVVAQAQAIGPAVYLDLEQNLDPPTATKLGVDLARLVLIEPHSWQEACTILRDFVQDGSAGIVVLDAPAPFFWEAANARTLSATLDRLVVPLRQFSGVLLFLITLLPGIGPPTTPPVIHPALAHYAALRLLVYRQCWRYGRQDVQGYEARVYIAKNKFTAPAAPVTLTISLNNEAESE